MNFKLGDLIYSPNFRNGTLGTVSSIHAQNEYSVEDVFIPRQFWRVGPECNWRIATDDDIINQMTNYFRPARETIGFSRFDLDEEYLVIGSDIDNFIIDFNDAVKLRDYLNKWIVTKSFEDEMKEYYETKEVTDE